MPDEHEELYEAALEAVRNLFDDYSVTQKETEESLTSLIHEINDLISALDV